MVLCESPGKPAGYVGGSAVPCSFRASPGAGAPQPRELRVPPEATYMYDTGFRSAHERRPAGTPVPTSRH